MLVTALSVHSSECVWRHSEYMVTVKVIDSLISEQNPYCIPQIIPSAHAKISQSSHLLNMAKQLSVEQLI